MTREEAIDRLISIMSDLNDFCNESKHMSDDDKKEMESLDMAIKALKQEPCEDAVSRQAVDQNIYDYAESNRLSYANMKNAILDVPSVTPTRKKGKWERGYSFPDGEYVKCTVCGWIIKCIYPMHYCPNCGAEMESEE